jgi:hypothetical protein
MKWLFIIWLILVAILICVRLQVHVQWPAVTADAQVATPTATPTPSGPATCTITGQVVNADGTPLVNGTITFNSQRVQVVGSTVVNPIYVTTNTDPNGNIRAVSIPMGLVTQVTICPPATGQGQSANCSAPFTVIIPFTPVGNFGEMAQGTNLTSSSTLSLTTLNVTGTLTYPDGSTYTVGGHNTMAGLAIGMPVAAPTAGQTTPFQIASAGSTTWTGTSYTNNGGVYNQANAWGLKNPPLTSGTGLYAAYYVDYCDPALGNACTGPNDFYLAMQANGPGSTIATPLSAVIQTVAPAGLQINNLPAQDLTIYSGGRIVEKAGGGNVVGTFTYGVQGTPHDYSGFAGLRLPFNSGTSLIIGPQGSQGLSLTSVGGGNFNIMAGGYYNGSNWIQDDTAGVSPLMNAGAGTFGFYRQATSWNPGAGATLGNWVPASKFTGDWNFDHVVTDQDVPYPTVSAGSTLLGGSRDWAGEIVVAPSNVVTLTFSRCFPSVAYCVLTDDGQPLIWLVANKGNCSVQFICYTNTGAPCTANNYVNYVCTGS